jgi:peptidoglycan/LPS O-acetylase OafA/YrhL
MSLIENFRYRPEIDGLRAVAVLAVVLFHADLRVPGGFVGVDVFFVISGFLITSLILRDLEAGKFTLVHFWERRARRIVPAAVVMVMAVITAGWFLLLPSDYAALGKSAGMHAAFGANFYFWRNTNYFASSADEQPLLHTWSLSVEEQFYVIVPFLLLFLFRYPLFRRRSTLLILLTSGFLISLALSILLLPREQAAAFYLLPTRAWELLAGSIVALLPAVSLSRLGRELLCGLALTAILAPCFLYDKQTAFPGLAALAPCLGSALFIWISGTAVAGLRGPVCWFKAILSARPLVFVGLISYSLYLWHWPLFAFANYWTLEPLSVHDRVALVLLSFALALLSWRYVETPFRSRRIGAGSRAKFAWSAVGVASTVVMSCVIAVVKGLPMRFDSDLIAVDEVKLERLVSRQSVKPTSLDEAKRGVFPRLGKAEGSTPQIFVWGDSHARQVLPAIHSIATEGNFCALAAWHSATAPIAGYRSTSQSSLLEESVEWNAAILDYIEKRKIGRVLMVARWSNYQDENSSAHDVAVFSERLIATVRKIRSFGATPYLMAEVPRHKTNVIKAILANRILGADVDAFRADLESYSFQTRVMRSIYPELEAEGAIIIDVANKLFDDGGLFIMEHDGSPAYYDDNHLSSHGVLYIRDAIRDSIR